MQKEIKYTLKEDRPTINIDVLQREYEHLCVFNSNHSDAPLDSSSFNGLVALGKQEQIITNNPSELKEETQRFLNSSNRWAFGYITYDLKNHFETLESNNSDHLLFPLVNLFAPDIVLKFCSEFVTIYYDDSFISKETAEKAYFLSISNTSAHKKHHNSQLNILPKISKEEYISKVEKLKEHIKRGNIYEINFCQEFYAKQAKINTVDIYNKLNKISEAPFSAYCRFNDLFVVCASPERFIKKEGSKLISQPIKGTAKRSKNSMEDERLKQELYNNEKERSENVMIVDLVRNDLSKIAKAGSVKVEELFGLYTFKQVHQLISTVSCELKEGISFTDILKATFPMGSMTGAPKVSAMKLIEEFESTKRGLYSGAIGCITPEGDFDFNVVIRSILYNSTKEYLSFMTGSAITDKSDAESEYEECMLKAKAMYEVLRDEN